MSKTGGLLSGFPECYPNCSCEPFSTGLVLQPWAFWTSIAYLVSAWLIYRWHRESEAPELRAWLIAMLLVALSSFLAHSLFSYFALALDMGAIVIFTWSVHLGRLGGWGRSTVLITGLYALLTAFYLSFPMQYWVLINFGFMLGSIGLLVWRQGPVILERPFVGAMLIYGAAFLLFKYDRHPLLCHSRWLPYGHPTWHLGSALTTFLLGRWWFGRGQKVTRGD
jgi:hypothetical protein